MAVPFRRFPVRSPPVRVDTAGVDDRVQLTQKGRPSRISHGPDVVAHTGVLGSHEICFVDGLPCTTLERTVVGCGPWHAARPVPCPRRP